MLKVLNISKNSSVKFRDSSKPTSLIREDDNLGLSMIHHISQRFL